MLDECAALLYNEIQIRSQTGGLDINIQVRGGWGRGCGGLALGEGARAFGDAGWNLGACQKQGAVVCGCVQRSGGEACMCAGVLVCCARFLEPDTDRSVIPYIPCLLPLAPIPPILSVCHHAIRAGSSR